jgi:soluble lytic murein transglycosylase-like protein
MFICLLTTGCAGSMKSGKVSVGQNVPATVVRPSNTYIPRDNSLPAVTLESLTAYINDYNKKLDYSDARLIADVILRVSTKHRIDYKVVTALVAIESGFRPNVTSPSGAMGLGQLMPATARSLKVNNPYDPMDNLNGAVKLLRSNLEKYEGDINYALAAYKMGCGAVSRSGISQSSTIRYIQNIRKIFDSVP